MSGIFSWFQQKDTKDKYNLETMRKIYAVLLRNKAVTSTNREIIVEQLRSLAEIMIYGDKYSESFFEFFCEKKMITLMIEYLRQSCPNTVKTQVIQTMSILVQNIKSETSLMYLFSGNHINDLITARIDVFDESITAYYVSFLKVLSLQLNSKTIQFFFNSAKPDPFPLYTLAIQFYNNPESMIRIAVRTLTLNVFKLDDQRIKTFVTNGTNRDFFVNIVYFLKDQCLLLDAVLAKTTITAHARLDEISDDTVDLLYYIQDILLIGVEEINTILCSLLLSELVYPIAIMSLGNPDKLPTEGTVCTAMGLHILQLMFSFVDYQPLITQMAELLLSPSIPDIPPPLKTDGPSPLKSRADSLSGDKLLSTARIRYKSVDAQMEEQQKPFNMSGDVVAEESENELSPADNEFLPAVESENAVTPRDSEMDENSEKQEIPDARLPRGCSTEIIGFNTEDNGYRAMLYSLLLHEDERYRTQCAFLLYSVLVNKNVDENVLEKANFSPQAYRVKKRMLANLTGSTESSLFGQPSAPVSQLVQYDYPYKAVENILLMMQMNTGPIRLVTMDICSEVLIKLLYDEKQSASLIKQHQSLLDLACTKVGMHLRKALRDNGYRLTPLLEIEWIKFSSRKGFDPEPLTHRTHLLLPVLFAKQNVKDIYFCIPEDPENQLHVWIHYFFLLLKLKEKLLKVEIPAFYQLVQPHSHDLIGDLLDIKEEHVNFQLQFSSNNLRSLYFTLNESYIYLLDYEGIKNHKCKIVSIINLHQISLYIDKVSRKVIKLEIQSMIPVALGTKSNQQSSIPKWDFTMVFSNTETFNKVLQTLESACEESKTSKLLLIDNVLANFMKTST